MTPAELSEISRRLRIELLKMVHRAKSGHTAGPLSLIDLLVTLYFYKMKYDVKRPTWEDRDRFILSCGHCCPALYVCLAEAGFFPKSELDYLRQIGSPLQGHPKKKVEWGIEMSTGSLGQGLSIANGLALGARAQGKKYRVYSVHSDGEMQEGMTWEAGMTAAHYKLDNRCALIDWNNIQIDGYGTDIMNYGPLDEKWKSFGWHVINIDGHDFEQIMSALDEAEKVKGRPTMIIAKTIPGKGVSIFEGKYEYHGKPPKDDELAVALRELGASD